MFLSKVHWLLTISQSLHDNSAHKSLQLNVNFWPINSPPYFVPNGSFWCYVKGLAAGSGNQSGIELIKTACVWDPSFVFLQVRKLLGCDFLWSLFMGSSVLCIKAMGVHGFFPRKQARLRPSQPDAEVRMIAVVIGSFLPSVMFMNLATGLHCALLPNVHMFSTLIKWKKVVGSFIQTELLYTPYIVIVIFLCHLQGKGLPHSCTASHDWL